MAIIKSITFINGATGNYWITELLQFSIDRYARFDGAVRISCFAHDGIGVPLKAPGSQVDIPNRIAKLEYTVLQTVIGSIPLEDIEDYLMYPVFPNILKGVETNIVNFANQQAALPPEEREEPLNGFDISLLAGAEVIDFIPLPLTE